MTRNPIYTAFRRTRLMSKMVRDYDRDARLTDLRARFLKDMEAIRSLSEREIITASECRDLSHRAARPYHAAVLRAFRADSRPAARRRLNRHVVKFHAEGLRL